MAKTIKAEDVVVYMTRLLTGGDYSKCKLYTIHVRGRVDLTVDTESFGNKHLATCVMYVRGDVLVTDSVEVFNTTMKTLKKLSNKQLLEYLSLMGFVETQEACETRWSPPKGSSASLIRLTRRFVDVEITTPETAQFVVLTNIHNS